MTNADRFTSVVWPFLTAAWAAIAYSDTPVQGWVVITVIVLGGFLGLFNLLMWIFDD